MPVMPTPAQPIDTVAPNPDLFSIEIGLFDEAEREDIHRIVPLARYLEELRQLPKRPQEAAADR